MKQQRRKGELYLNGQCVGWIESDAVDPAWGFGHFTPGEGFSLFAPLFGAWSMLLHEDEEESRASHAALEELRAAEMAIDALKAEVVWLDSDERISLRELTIDGSLVEWRP